MRLNLRIPLCFFDLETTGTNISQDRIVEIAVVKLMPGGEILEKHNRINPTIPIPPGSSAIHGIRDEDVKDKPAFKEVAKEYAKFMEGADLSGFNILHFDVPLLVEEFLRADVDFDYSRKRIIDSQRIYHLMEKRNLSAAYRFYCGKTLVASHSAVADTRASMVLMSYTGCAGSTERIASRMPFASMFGSLVVRTMSAALCGSACWYRG